MKYRSSSNPAASASARRTSRHAPLTQSTSRACRVRRLTYAPRSGAPQLFPATSSFCRSSASGPIIAPNDNSARPAASTSRGPTMATSGLASSDATSASRAPADTTVSGFSKSTNSPHACRIPTLLAPAKPRFAPGSITRTWDQRCRTVLAVPSGEALSTMSVSCSRDGGCAESDSRHTSIWLSELLRDDDYRKARLIEHA